MFKYPTELIDWELLARANAYYKLQGFEQIETPYATPIAYHKETKPHDNPSFILNDGIFKDNEHELVASAEQGFIYKLLNNQIINKKLQSITPCFRYDNYDELHQSWFMKLELFHYSDKIEDLEDMINIVKIFMDHISLNGSETSLIETNLGYDLFLNGIEVGSYGFRDVEKKKFIYGTGLALPRFSIADKKSK